MKLTLTADDKKLVDMINVALDDRDCDDEFILEMIIATFNLDSNCDIHIFHGVRYIQNETETDNPQDLDSFIIVFDGDEAYAEMITAQDKEQMMCKVRKHQNRYWREREQLEARQEREVAKREEDIAAWEDDEENEDLAREYRNGLLTNHRDEFNDFGVDIYEDVEKEFADYTDNHLCINLQTTRWNELAEDMMVECNTHKICDASIYISSDEFRISAK